MPASAIFSTWASVNGSRFSFLALRGAAKSRQRKIAGTQRIEHPSSALIQAQLALWGKEQGVAHLRRARNSLVRKRLSSAIFGKPAAWPRSGPDGRRSVLPRPGSGLQRSWNATSRSGGRQYGSIESQHF